MHNFHFWVQKVLPLVYDDSLSYLEVLYKVVMYINNLIENDKLMAETLLQQGEDITMLQNEMIIIQKEIESVRNGDYVSLYLDSIIAWIDKNIQQLVGRIVKYVFFGLSNDGHFIAMIPESWQFITFDTVQNSTSPINGHLILRW